MVCHAFPAIKHISKLCMSTFKSEPLNWTQVTWEYNGKSRDDFVFAGTAEVAASKLPQASVLKRG